MEEVVYTAEPGLRAPGALLRELRADARVAWSLAGPTFARRLRAQYRRSWLGYLWLLLPPLATSATWVALSSARVLQMGATDIPYPLYVLTGTTLWHVFLDGLNAPLQQLGAVRVVLVKSRVPHEAYLLAGLLEAIFNFVVRLAILIPVMVWYGAGWGPGLLLAPLGVGALVLLGFAVGLLLTPLGLLYQDVGRGLGLATTVLFFLTPVLYPPTSAARLPVLGGANPVTPLLVTARTWLAGGAAAPPTGFAAVVAGSLVCLAAAWILYRLARPHLVARL